MLMELLSKAATVAMLSFVVLPRRDAAELEHVVPRYSTVAFASVLVIVSGGAVLTWQLVGGLHGLVDSHYGHVLLVKLGAFVLLLVVARSSKHWVDSRLDLAVLSGGLRATIRPFVISVVTEVALAVVVLGVVSVLVATSPAR